MTLKHTLENYLGNLVNSDERVKENLDKIFPNDSTLKEILDSTNSEVQTDSQEGEIRKMAKFEKQESELSFVPDDDNIIPVLDDEWFEDDVVGRFYAFLKASFGEQNFEKNEQSNYSSLTIMTTSSSNLYSPFL